MARPPSKAGAAAYRRLQRRLLRSVRRTVFVSSASFVFPMAQAQYTFCDQIYFIIMFSEIMFMIYVLSSMLESCMLGLILIMINLVRNLNLQLSIFTTTGAPEAFPEVAVNARPAPSGQKNIVGLCTGAVKSERALHEAMQVFYQESARVFGNPPRGACGVR